MNQKKETKITKMRLIPEELEGIVNDMYEIFQGDEYAFVEEYPEYTHGAIKRCWKKNGIGIYEPSPFPKPKGKNKKYTNTVKSTYRGSNGGIRSAPYSMN